MKAAGKEAGTLAEATASLAAWPDSRFSGADSSLQGIKLHWPHVATTDGVWRAVQGTPAQMGLPAVQESLFPARRVGREKPRSQNKQNQATPRILLTDCA